MVASRLHVLSVYGIAVISVIGAILTGLATYCLHEFHAGLLEITISAVLAVVVLILGILLFVGLIKSNRRVVLAYLIAHTVALIIATISHIAIIVKIFIQENNILSYDIYFGIASSIILIDWIFLTVVGLYYKKVLVCSDPGKGYTKCVEESLTEKTPED